MIKITHKTTVLTCRPEHEVGMRLSLMVADKIPTPRQFRAKANAGGVGRKYPKFTPGESTAQYVREYTMLNARKSGHGIQRGAFLSITDINRGDIWLRAFYAPLSTAPQFAPTDMVVEEDLV